MTSEFNPPEGRLERAHWKVVKLGDAVYSLKKLMPKLAAKLEVRLEKARQDFKEIQAEQERQKQPSITRPRTATGGFVYLIRAENGLYKIGKARDVSKRLQPFSVHFPMKWELIHSFASEDYSSAENSLHKKFARKRDIGEWFKLSPADVEYIKGL